MSSCRYVLDFRVFELIEKMNLLKALTLFKLLDLSEVSDMLAMLRSA